MNNDESLCYHFDVAGDDFTAAGEASSAIKEALKQIGVDSQDIRRTAIATYEAEINMVIHAGGGVIEAYISPNNIKVLFIDKGPGIPDIELAMKEGYSTAPDSVRELGFGAGMGLPNIKRYSDYLNINSKVDVGTTLEVQINFRK